MGDLPKAGAADLSSVAYSTACPGSNPSGIRKENWVTADKTIGDVLRQVEPTSQSEERRRKVVDYIQRLIKKRLGAEVKIFGSFTPNLDRWMLLSIIMCLHFKHICFCLWFDQLHSGMGHCLLIWCVMQILCAVQISDYCDFHCLRLPSCMYENIFCFKCENNLSCNLVLNNITCFKLLANYI